MKFAVTALKFAVTELKFAVTGLKFAVIGLKFAVARQFSVPKCVQWEFVWVIFLSVLLTLLYHACGGELYPGRRYLAQVCGFLYGVLGNTTLAPTAAA